MLRLRNTLTRQVDPVEPLEPGRVRMYTCGPTVYRYAHVGNLRSYLLADLIRRTLLYHGLDVFHVKNITDVGPPARRAVRSWRGPMLVQAGLESQDAGRDRRRVRGGLPRRRGAGQHPAGPRLPAGDRAHRGDARAGRGARGRRLRLRHRRAATSTTTVGGVRRLRAAVGQHARRPAGRPSRRRSSPTSATRPTSRSGRRPAPGRLLKWPTAALGRGLPGLAPRVLGDGDALPRTALRHPHRRHRQRLPAPRGRDRAVGADRRRRPGPSLGPRRVPADGRQEDGQVGRQLPARHRAGRPRHRPAGVPLPAADLALRAQARVLGSVARRGRGGARRRCGPRLRALGAPPTNGPWAAPARSGRGGRRRSTRRASRRAVAGHGGDASGYVVTGPRHGAVRSPVARRPRVPRSVRRGDRRRPRHAGRPRAAARDPALDDRRRTSGAGSSSTPMRSSGSTSIASGRRTAAEAAVPDEVLALVADRDAARAAGDYRGAPTRLRAGSRRSAGTSSTRRRLGGPRPIGRPTGPAPAAAGRPQRARHAELTRRSRREPKRSMIR